MTGENTFEKATQHVIAALWAVRVLPHGENRTRAIDDLEAAQGWIKQARDEWATLEAER